MKRLMVAAILLAGSLGAQNATDKKVNQSAAPPPRTVTIPKGAVKNANGTYTYIDKDGQKWIYANTPFGVMKEIAEDSDKPAADNVTRAIDKGDTVQFEHSTPLGTFKWEKKKSELTDEDRAIIDRQNRAAQKQASTGKPDTK